ncbi:MAG: hypothetical protein WBQ31_14515, partial [Candidatus Acidiferrales bacterium]
TGQAPEPQRQFTADQQKSPCAGQHNPENQKGLAEFAEWVHCNESHFLHSTPTTAIAGGPAKIIVARYDGYGEFPKNRGATLN